jgi:CMP-N,N'-diacetyllegionaminic acid synthase
MILLNGQPVLALVPARGGSKAVPNKNMRLVRGVPLIGYTLRAALKSKYITGVYLSSDDTATISYAKEAKVTTIRRPGELCTDTSTANDVVEHFLEKISGNFENQDPYIVYLQPTSPLRNECHIDEGLGEMKRKCLHKLISVVEMEVSVYKAFKVDDEGLLQSFYDEEITNKSRQTLPQVFLPNGAIYVFRKSDFIKNGGFPSNGSYPYIMGGLDSIDIDCEDDFSLLDSILSQMKDTKD